MQMGFNLFGTSSHNHTTCGNMQAKCNPKACVGSLLSKQTPVAGTPSDDKNANTHEHWLPPEAVEMTCMTPRPWSPFHAPLGWRLVCCKRQTVMTGQPAA